MFQIIADSACDLTPEQARQLGVQIVPFYASTDGQNYLKEGEELPVRQLYSFMVENPDKTPKTSLPSLEDYRAAFEPYVRAGRPVLCLCFTGKMSGGVGSARNAAELLRDEYPEAQLQVMDTTAATVTESIVVRQACTMRDAGCSLQQAVQWLDEAVPTNRIFFTVGNLDYLIKGGRIGKAAGHTANFLGIKPMILFKEGEIFSSGVARGRKKSMERAVEQLLHYLAECNADPDDYAVTIGYGYDPAEGEQLLQMTGDALQAKYPGTACRPDMLQIGSTIAVHTGPYALGMGVMRRWKGEE